MPPKRKLTPPKRAQCQTAKGTGRAAVKIAWRPLLSAEAARKRATMQASTQKFVSYPPTHHCLNHASAHRQRCDPVLWFHDFHLALFRFDTFIHLFFLILFVLCPLVAIIVMKDEPVTNARARKNLKMCTPLRARAPRTSRVQTFYFFLKRRRVTNTAVHMTIINHQQADRNRPKMPVFGSKKGCFRTPSKGASFDESEAQFDQNQTGNCQKLRDGG